MRCYLLVSSGWAWFGVGEARKTPVSPDQRQPLMTPVGEPFKSISPLGEQRKGAANLCVEISEAGRAVRRDKTRLLAGSAIPDYIFSYAISTAIIRKSIARRFAAALHLTPEEVVCKCGSGLPAFCRIGMELHKRRRGFAGSLPGLGRLGGRGDPEQ